MAKQSKTKKRKSIPRQTRRFQLRKNNPIDAHVAEVLDYARSQRKEVTMIRNGVRLLWALENNDKSVLYELFPHMKSDDGEGQDQELKDLIKQLVDMGSTGYVMKSNPPTFPIPKPGEEDTRQYIPALYDTQQFAPVAVAKASEVKLSADDIADNFLSMFQ